MQINAARWKISTVLEHPKLLLGQSTSEEYETTTPDVGKFSPTFLDFQAACFAVQFAMPTPKFENYIENKFMMSYHFQATSNCFILLFFVLFDRVSEIQVSTMT